MANFSNEYLMYNVMSVKDLTDFSLSGLPEMPSIKRLMNACKKVFKANDSMIQLNVLENRVYCINIFSDMRKSALLGRIYYIPLKKQLDVYDLTSNYPCISWINKKVVISQFSGLLSKMEVESLFRPLIFSIS